MKDMMLPKHSLDRARALHKLFLAGEVPGPVQHEVYPSIPRDSRENVLYFTLPAAVNFQRSSPALWKSALSTWEDVDTSYLFLPELVSVKPFEIIRSDLYKHRLAVQPNRHAIIWTKLCETFFRYYGSDPRNLLEECQFDVPTIINTLQREKKHLFPYLGGRKLSNYWLFMLSEFTDIELRQVHEISIIPDTHVIRGTIELGLLSGNPTPLQVEEVWRHALRELGVPPGEMHSALWRWSRNQFDPPVSGL